jgi:hypothetical protein
VPWVFRGLGSGITVLFLCLWFDLERGEGMGRKCFKYEVQEMRQWSNKGIPLFPYTKSCVFDERSPLLFQGL